MFRYAQTKLTMWQIWCDAFAFYKQTLSKIWYLVFIAVFVMTANIGLFKTPTLNLADSAQTQGLQLNLSTLGPVIYLVIAMAIEIFLTAVVFHRMHNLIEKQDVKLVDSMKMVLNKYKIILPSMLLFYAAVLVGIALFLLPAIFVTPLLIFNLPLILFKNAGWFEALVNSWKLVWGNWWRTFLIFAVPVALMGLVQNGVGILVGMNYVWLYIFVVVIVATIFIPFVNSIILVQFQDLQLRNQNK